jgi:putative ABC transport system permease protein
VAQANRELGLRVALGAGAADLFRRVISRGLRLSAVGVLCGATAGLALTRLFGKLLYNVSPNGPLAFASAVAVIAITQSQFVFCLPGALRVPIPLECCEIDP